MGAGINDLISRKQAVGAINELHDKPNAWLDLAVDALEMLPSAQPETPCYLGSPCEYQNPDVVISKPTQDDKVTFWKKRAKEYEEMVGELTAEMARDVKIDSVLLTEEGIAFKKKKPEQRWIPCDETVDIPDHEVMACDRYGAFIIGYLDCKDEQWLCESDDSIMYDPVAWCELPKPYKEGGTDER